MGQFIQQKIALLVSVLILYSCDSHKVESVEYTVYAFDGEIPRVYAAILRQKNGTTFKQIRYSGKLDYNFGSINPHCQGFQYRQGYYPDSSRFGLSTNGQFSYRRWNGFHRYEFDSDTVSTCFCFDVPIPLTINAWNEMIDESGSCLDIKRRSNDTIVGEILPVEEYVEFNFYECQDTAHLYEFWNFLIDTKEIMIVDFVRQHNHHIIDDYSYKCKIINTKNISNRYFDELWEKAQVDTLLDCSPF